MNEGETFKKFCSSIHLDATEEFDYSINEIFKKLDEKYYDDDLGTEHGIIVGSIGRGTATKKVSDVDLLFSLPREVKARFDSHQGNGQSDLLQEVKQVVAERYSRTDIRGDGQVVVVKFNSYTIELLPAFEKSDGSYEYPDTHDGGSWKTTNPMPEQREARNMSSATDGVYVHLCNMLRIWGDHKGIVLGGLLIDTLVYNYLKSGKLQSSPSYSDYPETLLNLFMLLSEEDKDKKYWFALGSNQRVHDKGHGSFIDEAKSAYSALTDEDANLEEVLSDIFGNSFSSEVVDGSSAKRVAGWRSQYQYEEETEEFVTDRFRMNLTGTVEIDCRVTQNGFRPNSLRNMLRSGKPLRRNKKLYFWVDKTTVEEPFTVYWKVRNCGEEAYRRKCVRGQIIPDEGKRERIEHTDFIGPHYVECYLVKDGICVARNRIDVPISDI